MAYDFGGLGAATVFDFTLSDIGTPRVHGKGKRLAWMLAADTISLTTVQDGGIISVVNDMTKLNVSAVSQELLDFTKAIGSESRIQILLLFLDGQERTVNQITEAVGLGQPTTSEHLAIMKRAGILEAEKRGKEVYYRPDRIQVAHYLDVISGLLKKCC